MKKTSMYIQLCFFVAGCIIWPFGWFGRQFNLLALGLLLFFVNNIIYAGRNVKERIIFLVFQIVLFTFILSRPIIGMIMGKDWVHASSQADKNVYFSILIVTITLIGLFVGAVIAQAIISTTKDQMKQVKNIEVKDHKTDFRSNLQIVALIGFYMGMFFFAAQEIEKLMFMRGKPYEAYFSEFQSQLPGVLHTIASFMQYALCLFLATLPDKRRALLPLVLFEISALPALIIGERNPIVLHSIFIFLYYFIRDVLEDRKKWIGRVEKILITASTPFVLIFLVAYATIRSDQKLAISNPFRLILDFFSSQGVTFDVLSIGYGYRLNLPNPDKTFYTLGSIIDYFKYGRIGQMLFGTTPIPDGNNMIRALEGNSLSNHLSYVTKKEEYLTGHGWGSSFILEGYLDGGYIGVAVLAVILGFLFIYSLYWFRKTILLRTIVLVALTTLFFIPRAETSSFIMFLFTLQFWLCIAACYLGAYICIKSHFLQNLFEKLHFYQKRQESGK